MKALRRSFLFSNFKEYAVLAKLFSFWLAFLQRDLTWGSNFSLLLILITRSFSHLLLEMAIPPMLIWIYLVVYLRRCDFSGFAFRRFSMKHLKKRFDYLSRLRNTLFKFMLSEWTVLSSGWLAISRLGKNWNKLHRHMLNSNDPSINPQDNFRSRTVCAI